MAWLFIILLSQLVSCCIASNFEGNALIAIKEALNDSEGVLISWDVNLLDPCSSWRYVTCDGQKHVIAVSLALLGFSGYLSSQIGNLTFLQTLELQDNLLSGYLPSELGNLTQLLSFNIHNNSITGSIPNSMSHLSKLKYLILSNNSLTGGIPIGVAEISTLLKLDLSHNHLKGNIPEVAFEIPEYSFADNQLSCDTNKPCILDNHAGIKVGAQETSVKKLNLPAILGGVLGGMLALTVCTGLILKFGNCYGPHMQDTFVDVAAEDDLKISFGQLKKFSWRELQTATDNFDEINLLGQGGFGKVYKGVLGDGTPIAVKRLKDKQDSGGLAAFLREVDMIGVAVHRNLLHLIGYCATPERLLVYPFMANKSVAYQLRERSEGMGVLDWRHRKDVALGAARGLAYLHHHCNPRIIHRDVKAANVLLDENLQAVVGDFGLAKSMENQNTYVTTFVRGTLGHIAPEYLSTGKSSVKADVFGFGIMLLELVTGQSTIDFARLNEEDDVFLLDHVKKLLREKKLNAIVDPSLQQYIAQEVEELIQVALLCTQPTPEDRPTMMEVVKMLVGEGLAERWEEWQQVEYIRVREYEMMPQRLVDGMDSTMNQEAIELSSGR
ncbi:hypothetical protein GOP47_0014215 [Adiantum capillus-veneris]|uniref:non-specific serine/threonine protein kinase n=1 Tax=Adiantum capillus-veneris TaxID=13818 RepID=A0A9D4ZE48_ADICA|nr:hypothetical protein GOP47_0014215 [Adiantum capillus-veneris]